MTARWTSVPRHGSSPEENEDAACIREDSDRLVGCVVDGATESIYARAWAHTIATAFVADAPASAAEVRARVPRWIETWRSSLPRSRVPWYVETRLDEGAHAAFVGVVIEKNAVRATAVGDCCLFLIDEQEMTSWPMTTVEEFRMRPVLLGTTHARPVVAETLITLRPAATLILASDAVAAWIVEGGPAHARRLAEGDMHDVIREARASGAMRNDDATALVIEQA